VTDAKPPQLSLDTINCLAELLANTPIYPRADDYEATAARFGRARRELLAAAAEFRSQIAGDDAADT
jgi:hypothetical protein